MVACTPESVRDETGTSDWDESAPRSKAISDENSEDIDLNRLARTVSAVFSHLAIFLLGGVLVVVVLILFLFDLRTATISCMAIPLSLLAAIVVLNSLGATLNAMTLGGLAIAIGEVVDDAVIDVENIARRLRENRRRAVPLPTGDVILNASLEVRGAVVYATFAVILVFLPVVKGAVIGLHWALEPRSQVEKP